MTRTSVCLIVIKTKTQYIKRKKKKQFRYSDRFGVGIRKTGTFFCFHNSWSIACGVNITC